METLEDKMAQMTELWRGIDHWQALAINWNIDNPDDPMVEDGMFEAVHRDVEVVMDAIIASTDTMFGATDFGTTASTADVLQYLCGAIGVLEITFTLRDIDGSYELALPAVHEAYELGTLTHPETGHPIEEWKHHTFVGYRLTNEMMRLKDDYKSRI